MRIVGFSVGWSIANSPGSVALMVSELISLAHAQNHQIAELIASSLAAGLRLTAARHC